ncbi:MAG: molybdopterin-guanine dinucleotide biosynthesis protein B [Tissierella sp.]|nr:molybdopterin-guanine dinucleotide biosynthesis protein B [Tissierella sp.]
MNSREQKVIAISGIKNSGKTTLITALIPLLKDRGLKVATIKHDGHDFDPDVEGTDSYSHRKSGAYGVGIFSKNKWMVIKEEKNVHISNLIQQFPEADLIILEGFKNSDFPKVEIVRSEISLLPISNSQTVIAYISDLERFDPNIKQFRLDEIKELSNYVYDYIMRE